MPDLIPVDHDPFSDRPTKLVPVDYNPFDNAERVFGFQQDDFPRPQFEPPPGFGASFNGPMSKNIEDRRMWGGARPSLFNYDSLGIRDPYPFRSQGASPARTIDNFNTSGQGTDVSPLVPTPITPQAPSPFTSFGSLIPVDHDPFTK